MARPTTSSSRSHAASERLGFDAFFRSDHYLTMNDDGRPGPTDAWATLAALGRETATIRLGTMVTPITFRWPGQLAIQVAQADAMSGGRVELGIGAGWYAAEHAAYGIPFPATGTRFEMLDEQLAIITGLWATPDGERFDYEGTHYRIEESPGLPKPVQQPRPPIIVGGVGTQRTPRLAATYADEFNVPFMPLDGFRPACATCTRRVSGRGSRSRVAALHVRRRNLRRYKRCRVPPARGRDRP